MGLMEKLKLSCIEELERLLDLELVFRLVKGSKDICRKACPSSYGILESSSSQPGQ